MGNRSGNMFDFFYRVSAKLTLDLKKPFKLVNMVRQDETAVHDAVREVLVNCLTNADFYEPRGVVIRKYPDKIVFENPGTAIVGKKQMLRGGISEPRNEAVMKMFNLIGYGERAGSGIPDIYATWDEAGYSEPMVEEVFGNGQPNRTVLTLPLSERNRVASENEPQNEPQSEPQNEPQRKSPTELKKQMVELISNTPTITREELAHKLGTSRSTVSRWIKENGKISYKGSSKTGFWTIKE